jgi:hypothetical protein
VIGIVLFLLSCIATGALIRAAAEHDAERPFGLGPAWRAGVAAFWRILGLRLIGVVGALVIAAVLGALFVLGLVSATNGSRAGVASAIILGVVLLLALIPVFLVWGLVYQLALRSIVLELQGPVAAIQRAFSLLFRRLGRVALAWLIYFGVGLAAGVVTGIIVLGVALPFAALVAVAIAAQSTALLVGVIAIGALVVLAAALVAGGAVGAYMSTYWTLAYRRLDLDPLPEPPSSVAPVPA